ncbi:MAG: superoxide dismutase [archaeon]
MKHTLPNLPYEYNALEPYIDEQTMKIHHSKHHQTYVDKLNAALEQYVQLQKKPVEDLIKNINEIPEEIRTQIRNHGGGHLNHSFFWPLLKKNVKISDEIEQAINKKFGSYEKFKEEFSKSALSLFGSGWTWLVLKNNKLEIINTQNQNSPLSEGMIPLLTIDVWEHAYYLRYMNKRSDYIEAFFNIINWDKINEHYLNSTKKTKSKKIK